MLDPKKLSESLGLNHSYAPGDPSAETLRDYINLKLAARGFEIVGDEKDYPFLQMGRSMLANFRERVRLLADYRCPADERIHGFLKQHLSDCADAISDLPSLVPHGALVLERHGFARMLSCRRTATSSGPASSRSYRVAQGVCHNPAKRPPHHRGRLPRRRGRSASPGDKKAVPKATFARLLAARAQPARTSC